MVVYCTLAVNLYWQYILCQYPALTTAAYITTLHSATDTRRVYWQFTCTGSIYSVSTSAPSRNDGYEYDHLATDPRRSVQSLRRALLLPRTGVGVSSVHNAASTAYSRKH